MARQSKSTSTGVAGSTTVAVTLDFNVVVGSKIVGLWFCNSGGVDDLISITDALGNAAATIVDTVNPGGDIQKTFYYDVTVAGACTITATTTGSYGFRGLAVKEVQNLAQGAPDQHTLISRTTPGTGLDAITSGNVTTTTPGQYILGAVHVNNTVSMTISAGTGFAFLDGVAGTASVSPVSSEGRIRSAAGVVAATFTQSSNQDCVVGVMTFKSALSGLNAPRHESAVDENDYDISSWAGQSSQSWYDEEMFSVVSAGAYTLPAATGVFVLTGIAAALQHNDDLAAAVGTFTLSGKAANLLKGYVVSGVTGSYVLSGKDAAFVRSYVLAAAKGTFVLTGNVINLLVGRVVSAGVGGFSEVGVAAGFLLGRVLSASVGQFALVGNAADLIYSAAGGGGGPNQMSHNPFMASPPRGMGRH